MGLFDSGGGNPMNSAYKRSTKAIAFNPVDLQLSGIGSTSFTTDKNKGLTGATLTQDPAILALQNLLLGGAAPAVEAGQAGIPGVGTAAGSLLNTGQGFIDQLGSYDPMQVASERYNALQAIMAPQRARDMASAESRLFNQGRLDSSGGALQLEAIKNAQAAQDAALADRQFTEAQNAQINLANLGQNLTGAGAGLYSGLLNTGTGMATSAQGLNQPLLNLLSLSSGLGTTNLSALQARQAAIGGYNSAQASQGGGFLGNLLPAVATAAGTAFGGPLGGMAAGALTNALTAPPSAGTQAATSLYNPLTTSFGSDPTGGLFGSLGTFGAP